MPSLEKAALGRGMVFEFYLGERTPNADAAQAELRCGLRLSKAAGKGNGAIVALTKEIFLRAAGVSG